MGIVTLNCRSNANLLEPNFTRRAKDSRYRYSMSPYVITSRILLCDDCDTIFSSAHIRCKTKLHIDHRHADCTSGSRRQSSAAEYCQYLSFLKKGHRRDWSWHLNQLWYPSMFFSTGEALMGELMTC